ncbi:hypothetical protein Bbelb_126550 [Branchiostoma belcheri]|nr:hypothetical protein Bbelb_126550 [Branchiostoma belcheri]
MALLPRGDPVLQWVCAPGGSEQDANNNKPLDDMFDNDVFLMACAALGSAGVRTFPRTPADKWLKFGSSLASFRPRLHFYTNHATNYSRPPASHDRISHPQPNVLNSLNIRLAQVISSRPQPNFLPTYSQPLLGEVREVVFDYVWQGLNIRTSFSFS